jgi:hypothetical protein
MITQSGDELKTGTELAQGPLAVRLIAGIRAQRPLCADGGSFPVVWF